MICVDGTFLTGKYRGQILTAIGTDGHNQIVPLAFTFMEGENFESWLWFFWQLKVVVVKDHPNVCILHDRHAGILKDLQWKTSQCHGRICRAVGACDILGQIISHSLGARTL
jgi:hypothetical protein